MTRSLSSSSTPAIIARCDSCGHRFVEGETAFEHDIDRMTIVGETVTRAQAVVWICEKCEGSR